MAKFGLGADDLLPGRPDLVYASLSGYGETVPAARRRSMDKIVQAGQRRLFDAAPLLQAPDIAGYSVLGPASRDTAVAGYLGADQFPTSDGAVFIAAYYDWHWKALCGVLGLPEFVDDPRFHSRESRTEPANAAVLRAGLREATARWTSGELIAAL